MNVPEIRRARFAGLASLVLLALLALSGSLSSPAMAATGVSGQLGNWGNIQFGEGPGELLYPRGEIVGGFGVDPVDGSTYILSNNLAKTEATIDKFTSAGVFEGSATIARPVSPGGLTLGIVGIAVDHQAHRLYVVTSEYLESTPIGEAFVAKSLLTYSTEVTGGQLTLEGSAHPLPGSTEPGAIFSPVELHADETTGEVVLSGVNPAGKPVLQRLSSTGVEGKAYAESGDVLNTRFFGLGFSFDVASSGTTYVLANAGSEGAPDVRAFTLPPEFEPQGGGALNLAPIPGFSAAATAEGWGTHANDYSAETTEGRFGPQFAVVTAPDGEVTIYWKVFNLQESRSKVLIHGFSVQQGATTPAFGGGAEQPECAIEGRGTALAGGVGGALVVFDQGEEVQDLSSEPGFGPNLYRFGFGGGECPNPAPAAKLTVGGQAVSTVAPGTTVTLDGSGTEAGDSTIESAVWVIKGPGGSETVAATGANHQATHAFNVEGDYTVSLKIKTAEPVSASGGSVGDEFVGKPVKLSVSSAGLEPPVVTKIEPTSGPATGGTAVTITGEHLTGATAVEFGAAAGTITNDTDTAITVTSPAGTVGSKAAVKVTTGGGSAASTEEFEWTAVPAPVITGISPAKGPAAGGTVVTITGEHLTGATAVEFGTTAGTVTSDTDTKITVTSPAGAGGTKAAIKVTTPGGSATSTAQFEWEVPPPIVKRKLTISIGGSGAGGVLCDGGACAAEYVVGTTVTLTAAPDSGSTFGGWSGGGCSGTAPCKVAFAGADVVVGALFDKAPPAGGGGNGNSGGGGNSPGGGTTTKPGPTKTPAQILQEKRQKAIAKCKKLHGKSKTKCLKKAQEIGKPKKKGKPGKKTPRDLAEVVGGGHLASAVGNPRPLG
jgi:hypothetical protein